jgi:hypothetical protein
MPLAHLALAAVSLVACSKERPAPVPRPASRPVPVETACDTATSLLSLGELARYCNQPGIGLEVDGHRCTYRLATAPRAAVRVSFETRNGRTFEAMRALLARYSLTPVPDLGPRAVAYRSGTGAALGLLFQSGKEVVLLESNEPYCTMGPLFRMARVYHAELAGRR